MARQPNAVPPKPAVNGHDAEIEVADGIEASAEIVVDEPVDKPAEGDPGIEDLRKQLDEERQKREAAERREAELRAARQQDQREVADTRLLVIDGTITNKEAEKREWQAKKLAAKESGDYQAEVEADDALQVINIDLKQAKLGKSRLETELEEAKSAPAQDGDRLEQYIAASNMHPKSAEWLRGHRDYAEDPVKNAELVLAHQKALRAGHAINTPAYFEAIEQNLGLGAQQEQEQQDDPPAARPQRQSAAPVAPPSRGAGMGGGGKVIANGIVEVSPGKYRVSPQVAEAAAMSGITITEYVEQAKRLTRGSDGQLH